MDLLPTICAAAGVPIPENLDGQNILPLLSGEAPSLQHETLIWDTGHETAVREGKWKLRIAKSNEHAKRQGVELELGEFLYDLDTDPGEANNLADAHPDVLTRLKKTHAEWRAGLKTR